MNNVIIAIVGNAGSGKTHMANFLQKKLGIEQLVSLTSRPMRSGEIDGVDHVYVTNDIINEHLGAGDTLAHTWYGGYQYCALKSDVRARQIVSYIIDEKGLDMLLREHSQEFTVVSVYVRRDVDLRIECGVSQSRIDRDKNRLVLNESIYDCIITNNGTLDDFERAIMDNINM
ncbi:MAG: hypothetical protein ACRDD8_06145 [Bacteroidales bacterium]